MPFAGAPTPPKNPFTFTRTVAFLLVPFVANVVAVIVTEPANVADLAREYHARIHRNEAGQSSQVRVVAAPTAWPIPLFEARHADDAGQEMVAAEQDSGGRIPQGKMTLRVPETDHTQQLATARVEEVSVANGRDDARVCPPDQAFECGVPESDQRTRRCFRNA